MAYLTPLVRLYRSAQRGDADALRAVETTARGVEEVARDALERMRNGSWGLDNTLWDLWWETRRVARAVAEGRLRCEQDRRGILDHLARALERALMSAEQTGRGDVAEQLRRLITAGQEDATP